MPNAALSDLPIYTGHRFKQERLAELRSLIPKPGGYKWLDKYIDSLDPDKDWEQIIRTEFNYTYTEFGGSIPHTTAFINVIENPVGGKTLAGTGKIFGKLHGHARAQDANGFLFTWMLEGVSSSEGKASLARLNRLHMGLSKQFPGNFADPDDYIVAVVNLAIFQHRLREVFDLPPLPENRRIAQVHWCRALWSEVITEIGPTKMEDFPSTWEEILEWDRAWHARPHEPTEEGHRASEALIEHFCFMWLPRPLWFLGREFILMILPDEALRKHRLGPRKPVLDAFIYHAFRTLMLVQSLAPDPRTGLLDVIEAQERKRMGLPDNRPRAYPYGTVFIFSFLTITSYMVLQKYV